MTARIALALALLLLQPAPPAIHPHGCSASFCALVQGAESVASDGVYQEQVPEAGYRLLIFDRPPVGITATGPGGVFRWPGDTPPPPTATPAPVLTLRQIMIPVQR